MDSPFSKSTSSPGEGRIVVSSQSEHVCSIEHISYQYPLKLISPSPKLNQASVLVFVLSYGGGLVSGDQVNLSIEVRSSAKLAMVTQGHTKVFQSIRPDVITRQSLRVDIQKDAALCLLPDPVQPFKNSVYEQIQIFNVAPSASLCMLDWVTHGRSARGENWSLTKWVGRNEVWASGPPTSSKPRLLIRDAIILDGQMRTTPIRTLPESMCEHAVIGTLILRGPTMQKVGDFFVSEFEILPRLGLQDFRTAETCEKEAAETPLPIEKWRTTRIAQEKESNLLWSAASVRGCVIVKFGAATVEGGRRWIGSMLLQEGSIEREFGEQALMCVR
ncbi:UreD-domain-containing protein [Xylaria sp. CBS 124048]|nr:UreD-domain-containing protein [Xylaria sp. CBS 124048]